MKRSRIADIKGRGKHFNGNGTSCDIPQSEFVGNKAEGRISKRVLQSKQSTPSFLKNEHFLPPDKCSFFRKFGVLCFLVTPVFRFALLRYYRRITKSEIIL